MSVLRCVTMSRLHSMRSRSARRDCREDLHPPSGVSFVAGVDRQPLRCSRGGAASASAVEDADELPVGIGDDDRANLAALHLGGVPTVMPVA